MLGIGSAVAGVGTIGADQQLPTKISAVEGLNKTGFFKSM
jgi:hypothetical protein